MHYWNANSSTLEAGADAPADQSREINHASLHTLEPIEFPNVRKGTDTKSNAIVDQVILFILYKQAPYDFTFWHD